MAFKGYIPVNYRKCRYCGYRPKQEPGKFCCKCGREYDEVHGVSK